MIVDGYFEVEGRGVIIEVYGPSHFDTNGDKNKDTQDKEDLLTTAASLRLVSIGYRYWNKASDDEKKQQ